MRLLQIVGHQTAVACERARLAEAATRAARADERNALARDIHDSLAQDLAGVVLQLEAAEARECHAVAAGGAGECLPHLRRALDLARHAMAAARRSVVQLRDGEPGAGPSGLGDGLRALRAWSAALGAALIVRAPPHAQIDGEAAAVILAIAREATANAIRHGHAAHGAVAIMRRAGRLRVRVTDDG